MILFQQDSTRLNRRLLWIAQNIMNTFFYWGPYSLVEGPGWQKVPIYMPLAPINSIWHVDCQTREPFGMLTI